LIEEAINGYVDNKLSTKTMPILQELTSCWENKGMVVGSKLNMSKALMAAKCSLLEKSLPLKSLPLLRDIAHGIATRDE
jgi:hypothetical protein